MFIDAHTHAFLPEDLKVLGERLVFLDSGLAPEDPHRWQLFNQGDLAALLEVEAQAGVDRFVLLPVTGRVSRISELNRWAAESARSHPAIIPFGILHPAGDVRRDLAELLELGLKGVKLHPFVQRFTLEDPATHAMLELVADTGLPVMCDTISRRGLVESKPHLEWAVQMAGYQGAGPEKLAALAAAHPRVRFIAAHGGSLYGWDRVAALMELPNVYMDISCLSGLIAPDRLVELIRRKSPDLVMYGSDTPWRDPVAYRQWFEGLPLTSGERERVAAGTISELLDMNVS